MMRWRAMLLSLLLPGLGHTAIGRPVRGLALSLLFTALVVASATRAAFVDVALLDLTFSLLAIAAMIVYLLAQLSMLLVLLRSTISSARPRKEDHFRAGLAAASRGEAPLAECNLRRVLSIDPSDVEAHLHLGTLLTDQGRYRHARRHLKWCRRFDVEAKWDWEMGQELDRAARGLAEDRAHRARKREAGPEGPSRSPAPIKP